MRTPLRSASAALVACAACTGASRPASPNPLAVSRERAVSWRYWLDVQNAPPAYRSASRAPLVGPYYVLISYSRRYCVVDVIAFARAQDDHFWTCEWHYPHAGP